MLVIFTFFFQNPYSGTWTRTREPGPKKIPSRGPLLGNLDPYSGTWTRTRNPAVLVYVLKFSSTTLLKNPSYFVFCLINVLNLISMPIIDTLLLSHVSWVIGIESGPKMISSSQRYEVEKLAQYRWDIQYLHCLRSSS